MTNKDYVKFKSLKSKNIGLVNWIGLNTLFVKEVRRFLKVYQQTIIAPAFTSLIFFLVISLALDGSVREVRGINFLEFLAPGLIIMTMAQNAFANTSSSIISSKVAGNIVDILMPPLNAHELTIAYTMGALIRAILVGLMTFFVMSLFVSIHIFDINMLIFFTISSSLSMGLLGLITGIWAEKFDHMSAVTNFIVTPLTFLSGTFYSVQKLTEPFYSLCFLNPFFYMIDGFRYSFIGKNDSNLLIGMIYLTFINVCLYFISWIIFKKGWYLKN